VTLTCFCSCLVSFTILLSNGSVLPSNSRASSRLLVSVVICRAGRRDNCN